MEPNCARMHSLGSGLNQSFFGSAGWHSKLQRSLLAVTNLALTRQAPWGRGSKVHAMTMDCGTDKVASILVGRPIFRPA